MSPPICQALADYALERPSGALGIIDAQPRALVVAEVEFAEIALQVLLGNVMVCPGDAALEDAEPGTAPGHAWRPSRRPLTAADPLHGRLSGY